jgi:RNA polymerase sigma factor (TIGR02999 family)
MEQGEASQGMTSGHAPPDPKDPFDWLYEDLHKVAAQMMAREGSAGTLQATALVHEAYLRFSHSSPHAWQNRRHFFSAAVEAMRRILIEHARKKMTLRRGQGLPALSLENIQVAEEAPSEVLLAVNEALERLDQLDPVKAEVVKLRFFTGYSNAEVASLMGMAERTVKWHWTFARAWLVDAIHAEGAGPTTRPQPARAVACQVPAHDQLAGGVHDESRASQA